MDHQVKQIVGERIVNGVYEDRLDEDTNQPITVGEWQRFDWEDTTRLGDEKRRYVRVREKTETRGPISPRR